MLKLSSYFVLFLFDQATLYGADVAIKEKRVSSVHFQEEATALHLLRHKDIIPVLGVVSDKTFSSTGNTGLKHM